MNLYCKTYLLLCHRERGLVNVYCLNYLLKLSSTNNTLINCFNPIRAGGGAESARTFFNRPFLHEKRGLEVPNFVTFPNLL